MIYREMNLEQLLLKLLLESCDPRSNEYLALSVIDARLRLLIHR